MMHGTVTEFDANGGFGLIDADDGEIVFFNASNVEEPDAALLDVGVRVEFHSHEERLGLHADLVRICAA